MINVPEELDGAKVIFYTKIDQRHKPTGNCRHFVAGELLGSVSGLAICKYEDSSYYLFYCDEDWKVLTDTYHETIEDAMSQAEYEYEGVSSTWQKIE